jgi:hypothetical protein
MLTPHLTNGGIMGKTKVARSAVTGKFVKKSYAVTHKKTTVVETVKRGGKKSSKKK